MVEIEERVADHLQLLVAEAAVVYYEVVVFEYLHTAFYLPGQPYVVLVGEEDDVSQRMLHRILEVPFDIMGVVAEKAYAVVADAVDYLARAVGGVVVGHHHFGILRQLRKYGAELFEDVSLTIICCNANGKHIVRG